MAKRTIPRLNFNIIAATVIAVVIVAGLIGLEWRPASPMDGLLDQLQAQYAGYWENALSELRAGR